jgi:hypothetical protein
MLIQLRKELLLTVNAATIFTPRHAATMFSSVGVILLLG